MSAETTGRVDVRGRVPAIRGGAFLRRFRDQVWWLLLTLLASVLVLLPVIPLQRRAYADGAAGIRGALQLEGIGSVFVTTFALGVGALLVALLLGTSLALCMHAMSPRARRFLAFLPVLPMVIPGVAHVVGFIFLFSPENGYINTVLRATPFFGGDTGPINVYSTFWIIVYTGVHLAAFVYLFVYAGLRNLGNDYASAARVNGAGPLRVLLTVTLPLLRPVFVYSGAVCFLLALGQFTGPLILGRRQGLDVLTVRMFELSAQYPIDYAVVAALGTPLIAVALAMVMIQRRLIGNQNRFVGTMATASAATPSRWTNIGAVSVVLGFSVVSALAPLVALVFVALSPFWSGSISIGSLTGQNFAQVFNDRVFAESIVTSLSTSLLAVVIVLPLGMMIALGIYNRDRLWRPLPALLDVAANMPLTMPAALLGFGFLFAYSNPAVGLYGTRTGLVIAYVTIMIPYAVRYQLAGLVALGRTTVESSRVSGAGPFRTFGQIVLPLTRAGMASSAAIMFVLLIHEFGVSLLIRSAEANVMSVVLFEQYDAGGYPQVAVIALAMTVITAVGVSVALMLGGSRALEKL
ncbi:ABC transporter permease subunit [Streptomyces sp. NBC_01795]|uniref:ABC transporter permease n=1 Tax=unclassified Streptomyces TaxID=2593676 RepID=UPI002DDC56B6|nr:MULTISPECIES: ABC transporter permease subunit [unclassified Streptomyces]WSA90628.1 ABC transporter permease subunit [Streptomyces sp. NBC_01795]WSB74955.1 ABC transporter permease subunit [Streptomyces sp. NBC_01775]